MMTNKERAFQLEANQLEQSCRVLKVKLRKNGFGGPAVLAALAESAMHHVAYCIELKKSPGQKAMG